MPGCRRCPSDRPRFRRLFRNLRRISTDGKSSRSSPARVRPTSRRPCWMRSPGTTSRAPDRVSGDPDAIRCDFGLAPVEKRSGLAVLFQRRLASNALLRKTVCQRAKAAFGAAESARRRITRCEAADISTPEPPEASPKYQDGQIIPGSKPLLQIQLRMKMQPRRMARLRILLGRNPTGRASVACRCCRWPLLRAEAAVNAF